MHDAEAFQTLAVEIRAALSVVVCDDHGTYEEASVVELRAQAQYIFIIRDAEVLPHLVALYVYCGDDDDDFGGVGQLCQHSQLGVGEESGQHSACVIVVEELAAQLKIELSFKLCNTFLDVFALYANVFLVVETVLHKTVLLVG